MKTVLVAQDHDSLLITSRDCSIAERARVHVRGFELDRALAGGASPDGSPGCSLRAAALIGPSIRRRLARQVRGIVTACERPVVFGPAVPLPRERIAVERERLEALADALDGPDPVEPRGVASVALLLRDGGSPLYRPGNEHDLGQSVQHALDSLAVGSATHTGA